MGASNLDKLGEAEALLEQGEAERAKSLLQRAVAKSPRDTRPNLLMSRALALLGEHEAAAFYAQRARAASPDDPLLIALHGRSLAAAGNYTDGIAALRGAIERAPQLAAARVSLGAAHYAQGEYVDAMEASAAAERAGIEHPELAELWAGAHLQCGEPVEARDVLERALLRWPGHPLVLSHLCCVLNYVPGLDPGEVFRRHAEYGAMLANDLRPLPPLPPRAGGGPVTIGFVSPDLRTHSIAWFLEPLLEHLDRREFRVACYHVGLVSDGVTARLRALSDIWRHVPRLGPSALAAAIRADHVDIAVDLSGHTDGHRLAALHLRPARAQVTWLGYPNTTGVRAIDARLVDILTDPAGAEAMATERLVRLDPSFVSYRPPPPADAPEPRAPRGGEIVFGSFSAMAKINNTCAALWARVLAHAPGSRLVIKNGPLRSDAVRARVRARLARAGIPTERVELRPWNDSLRGHLGAYSEIHTALDTGPYAGTTTTCEALWMGVPVVTRVGPSHASRVGAALLAASGAPGAAATSDDEYVRCAARIAANPGDVPRTALRARMEASALCDAPAFARRFGAAVRGLLG